MQQAYRGGREFSGGTKGCIGGEIDLRILRIILSLVDHFFERLDPAFGFRVWELWCRWILHFIWTGNLNNSIQPWLICLAYIMHLAMNNSSRNARGRIPAQDATQCHKKELPMKVSSAGCINCIEVGLKVKGADSLVFGEFVRVGKCLAEEPVDKLHGMSMALGAHLRVLIYLNF